MSQAHPARYWLLALSLTAPVHSLAKSQPDPERPRYAVIGVATVPHDAAPDGSEVGGLSGIDYDPRSGTWYLISDDKSEHGPARIYPARITYNHDKAPEVKLLPATLLRNESRRAFPPQGAGAEASDAESIRVIPGRRELLWSTEGDARDGFGPAVRRMAIGGDPIAKLDLPDIFAFDPDGRQGPRPNLSIEGLSFTDHGRKLWLSLEAPLYQDGDLAGSSVGAVVRFSELAFPTGRLLRQVAYPVEPIGPYPAGRRADNGVSEILMLDATHMLVIERSGLEDDEHEFHYRTRVYCARLDGATNVAGFQSLHGKAYQAVSKTLAIDFSRIPEPRIDNVEGMALGPALSNGHASLVFITDNDFSDRRQTQVIALEIMAPPNPKAITKALCGS